MSASPDHPASVYLCQVGDDVSCGACCGLYNVRDLSRESVTVFLAERTRDFASVERNVKGLLAFKAMVEAREEQTRPFPGFHHCPYTGLVGEDQSRVGCLLHPLAAGNRGVDLRGISHWGGAACKHYFCPGCYHMPERLKILITALGGDWFTFGQLTTEHRLLTLCIEEVEERAGAAIVANSVLAQPEQSAALQRLLHLKFNWTYRVNHAPAGCHYFFEDRLYVRPRLASTDYGILPERTLSILRELETDARQIQFAAAYLHALFDQTAGTL